MRLYNGSNQLITEIDLSKSKDYKDFGKGFYMTADYFRAVNMASRTTDITKVGEPQVVPYRFNSKACPENVKIKVFKSRTAEWALFVLKNRDKTTNYQHEYDIVIGPVADSRVDPILNEHKRKYGVDFDKPENLLELAKKLRYPGPEYIQYCFCTANGIQQLILDL